MGANPINIYLSPRKKGECFSLPSEVAKIKSEFSQFEDTITNQFTSNWQIWENWQQDAKRFFQQYPDYDFYIKMNCDAETEYYHFDQVRYRSCYIPDYTQMLHRTEHIWLFSGDRAVLNQITDIQQLLEHPQITLLDLGEYSSDFQEFCMKQLFQQDIDYYAAHLLYAGQALPLEAKHTLYQHEKVKNPDNPLLALFKAQGKIQHVDKTTRNLDARHFSDQEIQDILTGFRYAFSQEKYQTKLKKLTNAQEVDALYQQVLAFITAAAQQGHGILFVVADFRVIKIKQNEDK